MSASGGNRKATRVHDSAIAARGRPEAAEDFGVSLKAEGFAEWQLLLIATATAVPVGVAFWAFVHYGPWRIPLTGEAYFLGEAAFVAIFMAAWLVTMTFAFFGLSKLARIRRGAVRKEPRRL